MKKYLLAVATLFTVSVGLAQKNTLYAEAGGNAFFGSLNYERQLTKHPVLLVRAGIGLYVEGLTYLTTPVGVDYLFRLSGKPAFLDVGMGATWSHTRKSRAGIDKGKFSDDFISYIPSVSYRVHTARGLMWRIGLTPVINRFTFVPWAGFSVGKRF